MTSPTFQVRLYLLIFFYRPPGHQVFLVHWQGGEVGGQDDEATGASD